MSSTRSGGILTSAPTSPLHPTSADAAANAQPAYASVTVVVLGASGDLAKKKTYPALHALAQHGLLPTNTRCIGYARSKLDIEDLRQRVQGFFKVPKAGKDEAYEAVEKRFLASLSYVAGAYDQDEPFKALFSAVQESEAQQLAGAGPGVEALPKLRCYYMALPPSVFIPVAKLLKAWCYEDAKGVIHRVVVEKPFGKDSASCEVLSRELGACWREDEIYRIDHYLGKEMVKNLVVLRFANIFFTASWNRHYIDNIQITFKEKIGTQGRGGYFDEFGIVRDIQQNHLLQVLALIAMERPVTLSEEDVRDEKVKVLKAIQPIRAKDMILGQYTANAAMNEPGYLDDPTVPSGSKTPTYAASVLWINNERWDGVPFIMKSGKALNEQKVEVRIQFRDMPGNLYNKGRRDRNELVLRVQPSESIYMKTMVKRPGLAHLATASNPDDHGGEVVMSELDLNYGSRYAGAIIPDAYEALLADMLRGEQANFVRSDELREAWRIFTPMLHAMDRGELHVSQYEFGSRGPKEVDAFVEALGYARTSYYDWGMAPAGAVKTGSSSASKI